MKFLNKLSVKLAGLGIIVATATLFMFGGTANANASCLYQYQTSGNFTTSSTPVFNSICGVTGLGNEPNFVRIRQSSTVTTTPTPTQDEAVAPTYSIGSINAACTPGQEFDVWNYLHNNALSQDNNNGSGSAVAHNVTGNLEAPVGTTSNNFNFGYTVSASNAATVSDTASLNCSNKVSLKLVPGSIHVLTSPTGNWQNLIPESVNSLNTPITLGNPVWGSGNEWGCWEYRILIIYEVQVTAVTPKPQVIQPTCNTIVADNQAEVKSVDYSINSATFNGYSLDLYSGSTGGTPLATSGTISTLPYKFNVNLVPNTKYIIVANVQTSLGNVTSSGCTYTFTTAAPVTPPTTPPAPSVPTTPTTLVNTGPGTGAMIAVFGSATTAGTGAYYWLTKRRLANNNK